MKDIQKNTRNVSGSMIAALVLTAFLCIALLFSYRWIYRNLQEELLSESEGQITLISENTASFLQKAKTVVAANAGSVEFLMEQGASNAEILDFLLYQTDLEIGKIDENFTGVYGYYRGEYLDGNRWDPYADGGVYYPKERPWYRAAERAPGEVAVASPYLDMDTGNIVLSVTKLLSDGESVLGMDVSLAALADSVSEYVEDSGLGYAYIVDNTGTVVASGDKNDIGKNYLMQDVGRDKLGIAPVFRKTLETDEPFEYTLEGYSHLVFSRTIDNGWQVILLADESQIFSPLKRIAVSCIVLLAALIGVLVYFAYSSFADNRKRVLAQKQEQKYVDELQRSTDQLSNYKRAILSDALISLEVNLSTDELYYGVWKDDSGKELTLPEILGLSTPCSYDEYIRHWNKRFVKKNSFDTFSESTDREHLLKAFESGTGEITFDYEAQTVSGRNTWLRRSICMIRNSDGHIIAYTSVKDISALVEAQKREESYIRALSTEYDSIAVIDFENDKHEDTITVHSNIDDGFRSLVSEEFLKETNFSRRLDLLSDFIYPADRENFIGETRKEAILASFEAGHNHTVDFRMPMPDGENIYYQERFIPIRNDSGVLTGMIACLRCIDAEIRTEIGRRRELEDARIRAEAANAAKSTFLFNMSHDIRTPMNAIIGFNNMAISHIDEKDKVLECLSKVSVSSKHLLSLINDVLDMARIEAGKVQSEFSQISVTEAAEQLADMFRQTPGKTVTVETDFSGVVHDHVIADRLHTDRILQNIMSNAVKYTPDGGHVRYIIKEENTPDETRAAYVFTVEDNGIGMSEEFLSHIFEEFTREKSSTLSGVQGTGLGMAITKRLVDLLGGDIAIESAPGKGTRVTIRLTMEIFVPEEETEADTFSGDISILAGKKILLCEDNELNREIAEDILSEYALEVETAENGAIAVERFKTAGSTYDLILMDIQMPVMDGYEATKAIRALEKDGSRVPIAAMTANAFDEDKSRAMECGMDAHIAKPINCDELEKVLLSLLAPCV